MVLFLKNNSAKRFSPGRPFVRDVKLRKENKWKHRCPKCKPKKRFSSTPAKIKIYLFRLAEKSPNRNEQKITIGCDEKYFSSHPIGNYSWVEHHEQMELLPVNRPWSPGQIVRSALTLSTENQSLALKAILAINPATMTNIPYLFQGVLTRSLKEYLDSIWVFNSDSKFPAENLSIVTAIISQSHVQISAPNTGFWNHYI